MRRMGLYNAVPPPTSFAAAPGPQHPPRGVGQAQAGGSGGGHDRVRTLSTASTVSVDVEAWTVSALEALSVSPVARGTGSPLTIPLDASAHARPAAARPTAVIAVGVGGIGGIAPPRRPPSRRDSQRRRELVLKGNEGSRQRRRWENDRLMHVPNAQPPQPADMVPSATHTVHDHVPYHVAQLWDRGLRQHVEDERARAAAARRRRQQMVDAGLVEPTCASTATAADSAAAAVAAASAGSTARVASVPLTVGYVPRELRDTAKRTPALKGWVRVLEEPVRQFLIQRDDRLRQEAAVLALREEKRRQKLRRRKEAEDKDAAGGAVASPTSPSDGESGLDSEDEEIVFVGRRELSREQAPRPAAAGWKKAHREVRDKGAVDSGVVFDALGDDESSAFKRWLTHSISDYYGLSSRSATVGAPPRRVVYVAIKPVSGSRLHVPHVPVALPRPLWELF